MSNALFEKEQDTAVGQYLNEIRQFPRLTQQEEKELATRCAAGDEDAIRTMVNSNLRLVVSVAKDYMGRGAPLLDMIQEGSIGLVTAARKFDPAMDCRFSTYAVPWIREGVSRCVKEHGELIRVPRYTADRIKRLQQAKEKLEKDGQKIDLEQLAAASGIPAKKAEELMSLLPEVWSLDALYGQEDGVFRQLLEDVHAPEPQEEMIRQEMKRILETLLEKLPERQRTVLSLRFGMEDGQCYSLTEIGERLSISKQRARQIERQAMDKLQKLGADLGLEDFLE